MISMIAPWLTNVLYFTTTEQAFCSGWKKVFCPGFPIGTAKAGQKGRDKLPTRTKGSASANVACTQPGPKAFFSFSFSVSFGLFLFYFRLNFVLEFKWSMNCSNININIYSFTHIKCNTKVNYIQSATQKSITYKVQLKFYLILSYLLLLSMFDTSS